MISEKQKRFLRGRAHHLKPVVLTGNAGLTEAVMQEIDNALAYHELIKVRFAGADRSDMQDMARQVSETTAAVLVQIIGHIAVFYRAAKKPKLTLP